MKDMIKKTILMVIIIVTVFTLDTYNLNNSKNDIENESTSYNTQQLVEPEKITKVKETTTVPEVVIEETTKPKVVIELSKQDQEQLLKIAFAEAGDQDIEGKALVMLVVLNRAKSSEFPNTIYGVIHEANQFSPVASGSFDVATTKDEDCLKALELVMQGYDNSQGATYFESIKSKSSWHYRNLNFLFEHGDHWFYN